MLAALCFAMVFALCLSSYVALSYTSLKTSTRFLMNMHCTELAESGIEQALYSQNNNDWVSWIRPSATIAQKTITISASSMGVANLENGETWAAKVQVTNYGTTSPSILSWGIVSRPDGTTVTRELSAGGGIAPTFVNAVAGTTGRVRFLTSGASLVDSYTSGPTYVGPGTAVASNFSAIVQSGYSSSGGVVLAAGTVVQGYAVATTASGVTTTATSKIVGFATPATNDPTHTILNPNPYQPQFTEAPLIGGTPTTITLANQNRTLGVAGGMTPVVYYTNSSVTLTGNSTLTIAGPVILYIQSGNLSIGTSSEILINSPSTPVSSPHVSLEIHIVSGSMSIGGSGIYNSSGEAKRCVIMGSNNSSVQTLSNSLFVGVIYFPYATLDVTGLNPIIYGSLVARAVRFSGLPTIHYDMALRTPDSTLGDSAFNCLINSAASGAIQPVAVSSVSEIVPAALTPF